MALASFKLMKNQWLSPPKPSFTEQHVPLQTGRVFVVTGANSGVGFELCQLLYATGAKIYMACRSKERALEAMQAITEANKTCTTAGTLHYLPFDLNDLSSVKTAAAEFQQREPKLDVLWNNAGMGGTRVAPGVRTAQGFEPMVGMHLTATLYFTRLLRPQLRAAVAATPPGAPPGAVRVVWLSSIAAEGSAPQHGIPDPEALHDGSPDRVHNYGISKVGSWFLGREMARRWGALDGIVSVAINPGNTRTNSYEGMPWAVMVMMRPLLHKARLGAYTELYAGLSPELTLENNGAYVIPWGRIQTDEQCGRQDLIQAMKPADEGGLGYASRLWEWCEEQSKPFE